MPSSSIAIDQLLASLGKAVRGSHLSRLDAPTRAALERFFTYLVKVEGKGEKTAQVYKSLCAKALTEGADPNNRIMKSSLEALRRFSASP